MAKAVLRQDVRAGEAGFTLLEVLVAFIIAALALAVLYEGTAGGLRTVRTAGQIVQALSHARSHLAAIGAGELTPAEQSGDDGGGFQWRTYVTAVAAAPLGIPAEITIGASSSALVSRLVLYDVAVRIDWNGDGGPRHVILQSRRLGIELPHS